MTGSTDCETVLAEVQPWDQGPPRLTGPTLFGASARNPFFHPVSATGQRPIRFQAAGLPEGLGIDPETGIITGSPAGEGEVVVGITASNAHGSDSRELKIVIGAWLALTPPLGWNSWNVWAQHVDAQKIRDCAESMVAAGLAAHGYSYVNIDDGWQGERGGPEGALQCNEKFPDMQGLCEHVHSLGLRIGIYSTPWTKSYAGYSGGSTGRCVRSDDKRKEERGWCFGETPCHNQDAAQWARWGIDYLKYDWGPWEVPDVEAMSEALKHSGRDIFYSLSNSAPFEDAANWARLANCWRTTGDIRDTWDNMSRIAFCQDRWTPYSGCGHWNDPDMLVVGKLGWGEARENRLTRDEQITHITMWAMLAAPMLIGCDMTQLDEFTIRLLCNDEVLAVNQDPLGKQGYCVWETRRCTPNGRTPVHVCIHKRELADGSLAVALFNRSETPSVVEAPWADLEIQGPRRARDLWARTDMGTLEGVLSMAVPAHGVQFVRLSK